MYNDLISAIMLGVNNRKNIMKKTINKTIETKNNNFATALKSSDPIVQSFFKAEDNESEARGVQMNIIIENIKTVQGRIHLATIGRLKLEHKGKDSADSFVRHIAKLVREGKVQQPKVKGKDISLKNSKKKGINWSPKAEAKPTADKPKADTKVDAKKVKADIRALFDKLDLADQQSLVAELDASVKAEVALRSLNKAPAKPKAKKTA